MKLKIAMAMIFVIFIPFAAFSYQDFEPRDFYYYTYNDVERKWKKIDLEPLTNILTIQSVGNAKFSFQECQILPQYFKPLGYECWPEEGITYLFFDTKEDVKKFFQKINAFNRGRKKAGAFPVFTGVLEPEKIFILTNQLKLEFAGRVKPGLLIKNWGFEAVTKEGSKFIIESAQIENTFALSRRFYGLEAVTLSEPVFKQIPDFRSFYDDSYSFDYWGVEFKKSAEIIVKNGNSAISFGIKEIDEINKKYNIKNIKRYYYREKDFHHYNEVSFINVLETKRLGSFEEIDFFSVYSDFPAIRRIKNALSWRNEIYPLIPFDIP